MDLATNIRVVDNSHCACGFEYETAEHYLFSCQQYMNERQIMLQEVARLTELTLDKLLFGDPNLTHRQNCLMFDAVHQFLTDSSRFN